MFILDYNDERTDLDFELTDESIFNAEIQVLTGDEILHVIRKDGTHEVYDSSDCRNMNFNDGRYDLVKAGKICLDPETLEKFNTRTSSYDFYRW